MHVAFAFTIRRGKIVVIDFLADRERLAALVDLPAGIRRSVPSPQLWRWGLLKRLGSSVERT